MSSPTSLLGILFALASAVVYGGGDFTGGLATRRCSPFQALALSAASGMLVLAAAALLVGEGFPSSAGMLWAALAGLSASVGIAALYRALATERAAGVAPTSAVVGALVPVIYAAVLDGLPALTKLAGFALAMIGIWLVTGDSRAEASISRRGLLLASLAGIGFGGYFICIGLVDAGKILTPLVIARSVAMLAGLVPIWTNRLRLPSLRENRLALLAGLLDAAGTLLFILSKQYTRLDIAAVLSSIYPASTVLLAAVILKEKISRRQGLGVLVCLGAIAMISL